MRKLNKTEAQIQKEKEMELKKAKRDAIKAAFELGYMKLFSGVEEEINKAKTVTEVDRVLITCRRAS